MLKNSKIYCLISKYCESISEHPLLLLCGCVILFYIPLIYSFSIFYNDDYYIFYKISMNHGMPVTLDIDEKFFFFLRPVTYFYFWLQYLLFNTSSLAMKYFAMCINTGTAVILFLSLKKASEKFSLSINKLGSAALCFGMIIHKDFAHGVLWISNINESLAALFYILTFYFLLKDKVTTKNILLSFIFYLLSVFSKQQGLHFPLLLILYYYFFRQTMDAESKKNVVILMIASMIAFIVVLFLNYYFMKAENIDYSFFYSLWKKPFAFAGTVFYMMFPLVGKEVYAYFLIHKSYVIVVGIPILICLILIAYFKRKYLRHKIFAVLIILCMIGIIYFPRMMAPGGERLNAIQLIWFTAGLSLVLKKMKIKVIICCCIIFIVQNGYSSIVLSKELWIQENKVRTLIKEIEDLRIKDNRPICIVPSISNYWNIPFMLYYLNNHEFGNQNDVVFTDVMAYSLEAVPFENTIEVNKEKNIISVSVDSKSSSYLDLYYNSTLKIFEKKKHKIRGYNRITFELPEKLMKYEILQYDGTGLVQK